MDKKSWWIAGGIGLGLLVLYLLYQYMSGGSSGSASTSAAQAISSGAMTVTPYYNTPFSSSPGYQAGTVPVVSNTAGVTPVNVGDYLSAFTTAPAVMSPTIGLVPEIANTGGVSTSTYAQNNTHNYSASAGYSTGMFSVGGSTSGNNFAQNITGSTTSNGAQTITFAP